MKTRIQLILCALGLCLTAAFSAAAQDTLWVSSESADLKAERSISSETIVELKRGARLSVKAYESRWYQVTTEAGQTGWVYRGKVSDTQPDISEGEKQEDDGGIGGLLGGLGGSSVETEAADSARSIRGLSPEAEAYAEKTGTPKQSREALDQVLSMSISESAIESFLKTGDVGEYAE
jgi:hypothetical protein